MRIEREGGMASDPSRMVQKRIDRLFEKGSVTGLDESQLLDRFMAERDELALEALVEWHGPMVLGVCRRWLADSHDVEDAFQATFLILVRKARALRDVHRLGPWLHGVAYRVAVRARADANRRRALEQAGARPECDADAHSPERLALRAEVRRVVDEEIACLPGSLRAAIVLCDLEGQSQQDAARILGWSEGSLRGRLARARRKLRDRLEQRGFAPAALLCSPGFLSELAGASPTQSLIDATTRAIMASVLAGRAAPAASAMISSSVAALAQGVVHTMTLSSLKKLAAVSVLAVGGLLATAGLVRAGLLRFDGNPAHGGASLASGQSLKTDKPDATTNILDYRAVRRSDRQPVAGAIVEVAYAGQGSTSQTTLTTDDNGHCAIVVSGTPTNLRIAVAKDGFVPVFHAWNGSELRQGIPENFTQELDPGLPIGGFVKDEEGHPVERANVTVAISQRPDDVPDEDVVTPGNLQVFAGFPHVRVKTDAQGRWQCSILPASADPNTRLWFAVEHFAYVSDLGGYSRRLSLKTASAMTGALIVRSGVTVRGEVKDTIGMPVPGGKVVLAYSASAADAIRTTADADGRFAFTHADNRSRLNRCSLSAEASGFAPAWTMIVPAGEIPNIELRLSPGKPFRGRVIDRNAKPVAEVTVTASWQECYHLEWKALTDANGGFEWQDAPTTGNIQFRLKKTGYNLALDRSVSADTGHAELLINTPVHVRGGVIDAKSKQVVSSFRAIPASGFEDEATTNFQRARAVNGQEGRYELMLGQRDQPATIYRVRIESDGYAPVTSRAIKPNEGDVTLDFTLTHAKVTSGIVRLADGTPASGAYVLIDGLAKSDTANEGLRLAVNVLAENRFKADREGRYTIPPQEQSFRLAATHDKGHAERSAQELARSGDITLKPWGRIEGTFRIRGKRAVDQQIDVNLRLPVVGPGNTFRGYSAKTDDQGRFAIERVLDGEASFCWSSPQHAGRLLSRAGPAAKVRGGETTHVDLGGQGRPLTGRIVLAAPEGLKDNNAMKVISISNAGGWIAIQPPVIPTPADFATWDAQKQQQHRMKWYETEQGRAFHSNRRFHQFPVEADGRFRIEDITPGRYHLTISVASTPGLTHPMTDRRLSGTIERDVEVPPIPGGYTDMPLDLGTMTVKLENSPAKKAGARF
jgi:RNA polymerase sigma factor (sigma-70 family)